MLGGRGSNDGGRSKNQVMQESFWSNSTMDTLECERGHIESRDRDVEVGVEACFAELGEDY